MTGGGSSGGSQTVTSSQQIPAYEQGFSQNNLALAQSLASQPYPNYQGQLQAPLTGMQNAGIAQAGNAATSYQPDLNAAQGAAAGALSLNPADPSQIGQYMSPYIQQALAPQVTALNTQLGQQQNQIAANATGDNAFGDARQGAQSALANFYGNQNLLGLLGSGYNTAFNNAQNTLLNQQQTGLTAAGDLSSLAGQQQGLGITGANALYNAGSQEQNQQQTGLNLAYQQFQNQVQWPYQQLNVMEGALANNPYNTVNQVTLPQANGTASGLGAFASLAGGRGSLASGGAKAPFGGQALGTG